MQIQIQLYLHRAKCFQIVSPSLPKSTRRFIYQKTNKLCLSLEFSFFILQIVDVDNDDDMHGHRVRHRDHPYRRREHSVSMRSVKKVAARAQKNFEHKMKEGRKDLAKSPPTFFHSSDVRKVVLTNISLSRGATCT